VDKGVSSEARAHACSCHKEHRQVTGGGQGWYKGVTRVSYRRYKSATTVLQESHLDGGRTALTRHALNILKCSVMSCYVMLWLVVPSMVCEYTSVTRVLQECYKSVTRMLHEC
jgi:hypothetical protein